VVSTVWKKFSRHAEAFKLDLGAMSFDVELLSHAGVMRQNGNLKASAAHVSILLAYVHLGP
jgi:hypothetical protein